MESQITTKKCSNCKKEIEASKLMLHEPYCMRSLKFCEICNNVIEIAEFEEHLQSHKEKKAQPSESKSQSTSANSIPNAGNKIDPKLNLKKAQSLQLTCEYCELLVPDSEFYEHDMMCGSRSTECEFCNKKLLYKQMKSHLKECTERIMLEQHAYDDDYTGISYSNYIDDIAMINKKFQLEEDEKFAKLLEQSSIVENPKDNEDLELAKRLQMELDERLAREYSNENIPNENLNDPVNNQDDDMDENLRRAIEMSKHIK